MVFLIMILSAFKIPLFLSMAQGQKPQIEGPTAKDGFNFLLFAVKAHWACIVPFLHLGFGREALSFPGLGALILLVVLAGSTGDRGMFIFLLLWIFTMLCHRINGVRLRAKGHREHSQYWGTPWIVMKFPGIRTEQQALAFEILLCIFVGMMLVPISQLLGAFIMAGGISLGAVLGLQRELLKRRMQQQTDAEIEGKIMSAERDRYMQDE